MKAIEFDHYGGPEVLQLRDVKLPQLNNRHILIRVKFASVNPKDCFIRKGKFRCFTGMHYPQRLGHDFSGEIASACAGKCGIFRQGSRVFGMLRGWRRGAYAEYILAKPDEIALMPNKMHFCDAAAFPLAGLTSLQALRDCGEIEPKKSVCINGASGGVGVFAIQLAAAYGANVTAVCSRKNFDLCEALGADQLVDYKQTDPKELDQELDIFFDVFGNQSFSGIRHLLRHGGVYVTTIPRLRNFAMKLITKCAGKKKAQVIIVKSNRQDLNLLADMWTDGKVRAVIEKIYDMSDARSAHAHVETKRARGKILLNVASGGNAS